MEITRYELWDNIPGTTDTIPHIIHYKPEKPVTDGALIIFPGSGYSATPARPLQEGERVAKYYCELGINVFVGIYRVKPDFYPLPILDGRRVMRFVKYNSEKFGINKEKTALMGYSAGGHLAACMTHYTDKIDFEGMDEIDNEDYTPTLQILCYPVISLVKDNGFSHSGSAISLLGEEFDNLREKLSHEKNKTGNIPNTFIWHNFDDPSVSVLNVLEYAKTLRNNKASVEMHIFPHGGHGIGLPIKDDKISNHDKVWVEYLVKWLEYNNFM